MFKNQIVIVTGGGSGIGEACVEKFAEEGAKVVIFGNTMGGPEAVAARLGDSVRAMHCNISDEAQVKAAVEKVEQEFGHVDVMVCNAAAFIFGAVADVDAAQWEHVLAVNVKGTALCAKYATACMLRHGRKGAVVILSSISAFIGQNNFAPYATTKAAVLGMTRNLAMDLAPHGIRVNSVSPGTIDTPAARAAAGQFNITWDQMVEGENKKHLLGRIGTSREVANAVAFLASDQASFITATNLMVDGGYIAH